MLTPGGRGGSLIHRQGLYQIVAPSQITRDRSAVRRVNRMRIAPAIVAQPEALLLLHADDLVQDGHGWRVMDGMRVLDIVQIRRGERAGKQLIYTVHGVLMGGRQQDSVRQRFEPA